MGKFLAYLIISGIIMIAMYLAYKLFIARDNQHGFNRGILLAVYAVSFSSYPLYNFVNNLAIKTTIEKTYDNPYIINSTLESVARPLWGTILIWIFLIGILIVTVKTIFTWISIVRVVFSGVKLKKERFTLIVINNEKMAPFSWFHYIIINLNDFSKNDNAIITHELKHVRALHWIDLLIAQIVCILNWFNPVAWLMR